MSLSDQVLRPDAPGMVRLADALKRGLSVRAGHGAEPIVAFATPTPLIFVQSAGSTNTPKCLRRRLSSWQASFAVNQGLFDLGSSDVAATLGPLGHSLSLYGAMEALSLGLRFALLSALRPNAQRDALAQHRVSVLYATPTQLRALAKHGSRQTLPALRLVLVGGGKLDGSLAADLRRCWPAATVREFFGASETSFITLSDAETPPASVGRLYPGVEAQLRQADATTGIGTLWVRSPYLFDGYDAGHDPATQWDGGWLTLGEMGRFDHNGYLFLAGRAARQVKIADHLLSLDAVEQALAPLAHPRALLALGRADAARGQRLALVIEGAEDAALTAALRRHCATMFGPFAVPSAVCFLSRLPVLPAGKPDYRAAEQLMDEAL